LTVLSRKIVSRKSYITVTGKGYRPNIISLGKWKYLALTCNILYVLVVIFLPIFILFIVSMHKYWYGVINLNIMNFHNYYEIIFIEKFAMGGFKNSTFLGVVGATVAMCVSTMISYFICRTRSYGRGIVESMANWPAGIPGIVLAMGFLLIFIKTPLYATIWVLMISYIIRFTPYGLRSVLSVLLSLSPELDESSRSCGASLLRTMKNITFPLLKPGFIAGWLLLFIIFFREFPISMLLFSTGNQVTSVVLWQFVEHRSPGLTGAYSMMQIAVIFFVLFVIQKVVGTGEIKM
jgi:iron(III) transport system permease protein